MSDTTPPARSKRVGLVASSGGHLSQLLLLSGAWDGHPSYLVVGSHNPTPPEVDCADRVYVVPWANRKHPFLVLRMILACWRIHWRERPDVVISTGAAAGCISAFLAKLSGKQVIWLDSISIGNRLSMSGRLVLPIADVFLVQWPDLAERHSKATYVGSVL